MIYKTTVIRVLCKTIIINGIVPVLRKALVRGRRTGLLGAAPGQRCEDTQRNDRQGDRRSITGAQQAPQIRASAVVPSSSLPSEKACQGQCTALGLSCSWSLLRVSAKSQRKRASWVPGPEKAFERVKNCQVVSSRAFCQVCSP